jgi:hypothetical protein
LREWVRGPAASSGHFFSLRLNNCPLAYGAGATAAPSPPYPAPLPFAGATRYFEGTIRRVDPPPARSRTLASASSAAASES